MANFGAPSFSLGLDLDLESENPPGKELDGNLPQEPSIDVSSPSFVANENVQEQTLHSNIQVEDSPPILKRLRRGGPSSQSSTLGKRKSVVISSTVDDDIEDFSSEEDLPKATHSSVQNHSAWSSSKFVLPGRRVLSKQWVSKPQAQKDTPCSNASASASLEASEKKLMFPKLTISPLRKFQLLDSDSDSDSDDPSASNLYKDACVVNSSGKRQRNPNQNVAGNQQRKSNISASVLLSEDLWKDFTPKKSINIPTPALDNFCDEYFNSVKDRNIGQSKEEDIRLSSSQACFQKNGIGESIRKDGRPTSYQYFYHDDPRIQRLVRDRLPHFFPLGTKEIRFDKQSDAAADIDYMSQFGHRETPTPSWRKGNKILEQNPNRRKNVKSSNTNETMQASANWVNPKSSINIPKDAGKRRVRANNHSAGHWYTNPDGRKVYITKNGQELAGQIAYRQFRKESGAARKSQKKTTPKKKSKR